MLTHLVLATRPWLRVKNGLVCICCNVGLSRDNSVITDPVQAPGHNFMCREDLCKLGKEYLNVLACKFYAVSRQYSANFDISYAFHPLAIAELSAVCGPPHINEVIASRLVSPWGIVDLLMEPWCWWYFYVYFVMKGAPWVMWEKQPYGSNKKISFASDHWVQNYGILCRGLLCKSVYVCSMCAYMFVGIAN